jgi:hypothetical protein
LCNTLLCRPQIDCQFFFPAQNLHALIEHRALIIRQTPNLGLNLFFALLELSEIGL